MKINEKILVSLKPNWIAKQMDEKYKNEEYYHILDFYIVNTICSSISCKGQSVFDLGWPKDVWKNKKLRNYMLSIIENQEENNIVFVKKVNDIQKYINNSNFGKGFNKKWNERIMVQTKEGLNQIETIFYHIRNSLAHGRYQIYTNYDGDRIYVLESGIIRKNLEKLDLRARMVLKEKTLLKWIKIITNPGQFKQEFSKKV